MWWLVRGLGVRTGVGISSILPFILPAVYFGALPNSTTIAASVPDDLYDNEALSESPTLSYAPIPTMEVAVDDEDADATAAPGDDVPNEPRALALTKEDKWRLARPLLLRYMLPLCRLLLAVFVHF